MFPRYPLAVGVKSATLLSLSVSSSFIISHHAWFRSQSEPPWTPLFDRAYRYPVPEKDDLPVVANEILKENNLEGAFDVQRPNPTELGITRRSFFNQTRLTYLINEHKLRAERQQFRWDQAVVRMHFRGGYHHPLFLNFLWAIMVNVVCVAFLVWIASGLVMWWRLAHTRVWGALALCAGALSFALLIGSCESGWNRKLNL